MILTMTIISWKLAQELHFVFAFNSRVFSCLGNQDDTKNTKWNLFKNHPISSRRKEKYTIRPSASPSTYTPSLAMLTRSFARLYAYCMFTHGRELYVLEKRRFHGISTHSGMRCKGWKVRNQYGSTCLLVCLLSAVLGTYFAAMLGGKETTATLYYMRSSSNVQLLLILTEGYKDFQRSLTSL